MKQPKPIKQTSPEDIRKISLEIDRLVRQRGEMLGETDLSSDLALETNIKAIAPLYDSRSFNEIQNTCALIIEFCQKKWMVQKSWKISLDEHAQMPLGVEIPKYWNAVNDSYFRCGAPIVISSTSGVGKSTTARNIIVHNIINKIPTVYVTNEDSMAEAIIGLYIIFVKINQGVTYRFTEVEKWLHNTKNGGTKFSGYAKSVYEFANRIKKYLVIIEAEYWSMSRIIFGIERSENEFGEPPKCYIVDYAQRIEPETWNRSKDVRLQMIDASRMWANHVKTKKAVGILISQLNDDGRTAESRQFEKDAGQWFVIERELDKVTEELSPTVTIRIKKGRRTGTGKMVCHIDGPSGALIPSATWQPAENKLYAD